MMKTITITDNKPFSISLNQFINREYAELLNNGVRFRYVSGQPYTTFEQMKADYLTTGSIAISTDYSNNTIFGDAETNQMFRAVHDMQHIRLNKDFTHASEYYITYEMIKEYRAKGLSQYDIDLLTIEMNGQISYNLDHDGDFPENQRLFTIVELTE